MLRAMVLLAFGLSVLAGCSSVPEVAARESAGVETAAYPALAPLQDLLASADAPSAARAAEGELAARAARLRARAAALRQVKG